MSQNQRFLPHIAMEIFNKPLMVLPSKLDAIMYVLGPRIGLGNDTLVAQPADMAKAREPVRSSFVNIGIVPVIGSFVHRNVSAPSGAVTYEDLRNNFQAAEDNPKIDAILLDIDSNGGTVEGVFATAEKIYKGRGNKPVYAYINEKGFSAGYLIASAAQKIFITPTGGAGSIGVRMVHVDQSEFDKKEGIKYTSLYVGDRKNDFDPHAALSEPAMENAMSELRELYGMFAETVARNRGMDVQKVRSTEAGLFMGQHAVDNGLADQVMCLEEVMAFIAKDVTGNNNNRLARGRAGNKKEVKRNMLTLAELKAESPDLYSQIMDQAKAEVEGSLQAKFIAQKESFQEQISSLTGKLEEQSNEVLKLQKQDWIRSENERMTRNETAAETIWIKALSACDIPEHMHAKVKKMVKASDHLSEGVLDEGAFKASVDSEIADWEGRGMKTSVIGSGFTGSTKAGDLTDPEHISAKKQEEADDAWVDDMLALGGQVKKGGEK